MRKEPQGSFFYGRGFSLAELVAVILIVSILSAVAVARFRDGEAQMRSFYDQVLSQVQYARKVAVAQRRSVFVRVAGAQSVLCYNAAGACSGVVSPTGEAPFALDIPSGISVAPMPATIEFDGLGRYPAAAPLDVSIGSLQFRVEHETGYARPI